MHFKNIGPGKYFRGRSIPVRFLEFSAVGPSLERSFVLSMGQDNVVVALDRPQDFKSNEALHIFHEPGSSLEALLEVRLMSLSHLKSI